MTNHWIDIQNADVILIMGSNAAENHPVSFKWVSAAMDRGAKLIHVDPRFTRTSAKAHHYAPIRPGTDIALLGGLIKYLVDGDRIHREYVVEHTNATYLVSPDFGFLDGLFTGFDPSAQRYDKQTWAFQRDAAGQILTDPTLQHERSVYQLLRQHFSRYDPATVSRITGTPERDLLVVYRALASTAAADRVATIMYAMGWTQHTHGTQIIRAAAIVQLLLGNIGKAGGGINALRGESNVQGSTDHCLLYHLLPGYLKPPRAPHQKLADYLKAYTPTSSDPLSANWWQHYPAYAVSLLKWMYGEHAKADNDFGYDWLPKLDEAGDYSWLALFEAMGAGRIKGFICWGQNPAVGGANCNQNRAAMAKLDWMVSVNLWDTETSSFWQRPGVNPRDIATEVFMFPCAASVEKEGSITNSGRWAQWRWKAVEPPGQSRADSWILNRLMQRLRALYRAEPGPNAEPLLKLAWDYGEAEVDPHQVAKEINGWAVADVPNPKNPDGKPLVPKGQQVASFTQLRADGSTACGNWLYAGSYTAAGNMMARRNNTDTHPQSLGLYQQWAWAWPVNRRILYNRASCDARGQPFDPKRFVIRWQQDKQRWEGDVPDGGWPPSARHAFIMKREGHGRIFGPGLADGPFPVHYEPWESPVENQLHPKQHANPLLKRWQAAQAPQGDSKRFPIVATTYRVTEHWQSGAMTRNLPGLVELQPEMFVELSQELAKSKGIAAGDRVVVESARGAIKAVAVVTARLRPLQVAGREVHQLGLPWHWGYKGLATGSSANELTPAVGDANTGIPQTKAFLCDVRKA